MRHLAHRKVSATVVVIVVLAVLVHLGLGGALLRSAPWVAGLVLVLVGVKILVVVVIARRAVRRRRPAESPGHRSEARIPTDKGARYAKQLCGHAAWKAASAEWTPPVGVIEFPDSIGSCRATATDDELQLAVEARDEAGLDRIERIVGANIERFGRRDGLTVRWSRTPRPVPPPARAGGAGRAD